MTLTRTAALSLAVAAMLVAPALQQRAEAQPRGAGRVAAVPRRAVAVPRRVVVASRRGAVVFGAYYRPLYFSPFYDPFYSSLYDPFLYRYGVYPGYAYGQVYDPESSIRFKVSPRNAEVFVDGYYAGTVDDFDGVFQRMRLEPGPHDVTLYLPGYRTVAQPCGKACSYYCEFEFNKVQKL